jgi:hypothetical protein
MYAEPFMALLTFFGSLGFVYGHGLFPARLGRAAGIVEKFTGSTGRGIRRPDCVAIIPGFEADRSNRSRAVGQGFITCHNDGRWSVPGAITLESFNPDTQNRREKIDLVMLSMNPANRRKLLSGEFAIKREVPAVWGADADSPLDPLFMGSTKTGFSEFDLDGVILKPHDAGNKALYGRAMSWAELIDGAFEPPNAALAFVNRVSASFN